jgi:hypothetical protein
LTGGLTTRGTRLDRLTDRPRSLAGWIALTFNELVAAITAGYHTEQNDDDTHKVVHATGAICERGRPVALGVAIEVPFCPAPPRSRWLQTSPPPGPTLVSLTRALI